ncbi:MAG: hypothetical protein P1P84_22280 [Deferrisomatales bacterium]|nr:hypothetical protein [Deferrisomatales bacterium]
MSQQSTKYPTDKMAAKKAAVLGAKKSPGHRRWLLGLGLAALIAATAAATFIGPKSQGAPATGKLFTFTPEASELAHPVSDSAVSKEHPK